MHFLTTDLDRPRIGVLHPVEDLHERGLACAVLTDDRVDLADSDRQIDVLVRYHAWERLRDVRQLDC